MSGLDYVLHDGTPMLRLPDGTGLSREDCLRWSKLLRKAAADLKRPAFQSVSYVRVDGLAVRVKAFRDNGKTSEHVFRCSREPRLDGGWAGLLHDLPPSPKTMGRDCSHGWPNSPKTISRTGS